MDRRPTQISFADTDEWSKRIPKGSVWVPGRTWTAAHIHDADCRDGFAAGGAVHPTVFGVAPAPAEAAPGLIGPRSGRGGVLR